MPATLAPTTDTCQASHELLLNRALSHSLTVCVFPTTGMLKMTINKFQSYDIHLELAVEGDVSRKAQGNLFLKGSISHKHPQDTCKCISKSLVFTHSSAHVKPRKNVYNTHTHTRLYGSLLCLMLPVYMHLEPNFRFMQFGAPPSMAPTDIAPPSQDAPVQVQQSSQ
eukprot:m.70545 g.70545  ORF g.70545 m.70545 type:complete len:167 (+) comp12263_c0_seq6:1331-1831(+)